MKILNSLSQFFSNSRKDIKNFEILEDLESVNERKNDNKLFSFRKILATSTFLRCPRNVREIYI